MSAERQHNCLPPPPCAIRLPDDLPLRDESSSQSIGGALSPSPDATKVHPRVQAPARVRASRRAMQSFVPRPFPPTSLAHVPVEYILDQLHTLAPHYWSKPETADCTLIVPLDGFLRKTGQAPQSSTPYVPSCPSSPYEECEQLRHNVQPAPRMVMKVHSDYLSAHSTLLRAIFSGGSTGDLPSSPTESIFPPIPHGASFHLPPRSKSPLPSSLPSTCRVLPIASSYPRLLPSPPSHPTVYLPLPDPASFRLLVHYMYFGSATYIEDALDTGAVTWEGLARNVEFLGMDTEIKLCLGRWYSRSGRGRTGFTGLVSDFDDFSDSDEDSIFESDDEDERMEVESVTTPATDDDDGMHIDECIKPAQPNPPRGRGRTRTPRRLGHTISDPGPIRARKPAAVHVSQSSSPAPRGASD